MEEDLQIPREGEIELNNLRDFYLAIDDGMLDFHNGRDLYRLCVALLEASDGY